MIGADVGGGANSEGETDADDDDANTDCIGAGTT